MRSWATLLAVALLPAVLSTAADKRVVVGARLQAFTAPGSLGRVTDTVYIRCFWPASELPFEPFAAGSSGIEVEGPPTPRNILFPADTIFRGRTRSNCFHKRDDNLPNDPTNPDKRVEITRAEAVTIKRTTPLAGAAQVEAGGR